MIRVALVHNHDPKQLALKSMMDESKDFCCAGDYPDAESFSSRFMTLLVDIVLMDIHLPGKCGIQTLSMLKERRPEVQFIICSKDDSAGTIFDSLRAGAIGFLSKDDAEEEMLKAIRLAHHGGSPLSSAVSRRIVESFHRRNDEKKIEQLKQREWEILLLLKNGFRYKEIACQLSLSNETVRSYVRNMYEKLEVHSRTDALNKVFVSN